MTQQLDPIAAMHIADAAVSVELETPDMTLNIGPQHPATHGVLRCAVKLDGEIIDNSDRDRTAQDASVRLGYQLSPDTQVFGTAGWRNVEFGQKFDRAVHADLEHVVRVFQVGIDRLGLIRQLMHQVGPEAPEAGETLVDLLVDGLVLLGADLHPVLHRVIAEYLVQYLPHVLASEDVGVRLDPGGG
mgnify:CR=1 FL=1